MNREKLCPTCLPHGECLFERAVNFVVRNVPPLEKQTPLMTFGTRLPNQITLEIIDVHNKISQGREVAKKFGCPNASSINPDYPGKSYL